MDSGNKYYDKHFYYKKNLNSSLLSAKITVPIVLDLLHPKSVVDVGCGIGTWVKVFQDQGIKDAIGIDFQTSAKPLIDKKYFIQRDLRKPLELKRKFDLAISLEVAEHIETKYSKVFVENLTNVSDVVLFSAAIPKQEGEHHINEQWHNYWVYLFEKKGFVALDLIRPRILLNELVSLDYRQNIILFVNKKYLEKHPQKFFPYFDKEHQFIFRKGYAKQFSKLYRFIYRVNNQLFFGLFDGFVDRLFLKQFFGDIASVDVQFLKKIKAY